MTIHLPPDLEDRLKHEASRQQMEPSEYAAKLLSDALDRGATNQATLELLSQWDAQEATDDPAEIAARNREFEDFRQAINRTRQESQGPDARKVYP